MERPKDGSLALTVLAAATAAALAAAVSSAALSSLTGRRGRHHGQHDRRRTVSHENTLARRVSFAELEGDSACAGTFSRATSADSESSLQPFGLLRQKSIHQEALVKALHTPVGDESGPSTAEHRRAQEEIIGAITESSLQRRHSGFSMEDAFHFAQDEQERAMQMTPREVLSELQKGNTRFWMGVANRPEMSAFERRAMIMSQYPQVAVLGCADSRVPVEIVFDQGLGDIFVVRVAGNCLDRGAAASLQYAVLHLNVKILVVMGHEGCGAVKAAQLPKEQLEKEPANLRDMLLKMKSGLDEERLMNVLDARAHDREAVVTNVNHTLGALQGVDSIMRRVRSRDLMLVGAFYEISSGIVDFVRQIET